MRGRAVFLVSMLALAACVESTPQVVHDEHTNQTVAFSRTVDAYSDLLSFMKARAFYSKEMGFGVETMFSNYGWINPQEVWSFGTRFPYKNTSSDVGMCGGAGGCITSEKGVFFLTETQFRNAAKNGLEFKLVGSKGSVVGKISREQFAEVLGLIAK